MRTSTPRVQNAYTVIFVTAAFAFLSGCERIGDSIEKNWTGHGDKVDSGQADALVAGSSAPPASGDTFSYNFTASRRADAPPECGARVLALQLFFQKNSDHVRAVVSSETWQCSDLDSDGATYYVVCEAPGRNPTLSASLMVVLYEPASRARINGEAVLTLSTASGACEHSYDLSGELQN